MGGFLKCLGMLIFGIISVANDLERAIYKEADQKG